MDDPIDSSTGFYYFSIPLLDLGGPLPLRFRLDYLMHQGAGDGLLHDFQASSDIWAAWVAKANNGKDVVAVFLKNGDAPEFTWNQTTNAWDLDSTSSTQYVLKESGADQENGYYYLMDPGRNRVFILEKRAMGSGTYAAARVLYILDRNGNRLTYTYSNDPADAFDFIPDRIEDGLGRTLDFTCVKTDIEDKRLISTITDQSGRSITINHAGLSGLNPRIVSVTDARGNTTGFALSQIDGHFFVIFVSQPNGTTPYVNQIGKATLNGVETVRVVSQSGAYSGMDTTFSYDSNSNEVTQTRPDNETVLYDSFGNNGVPKSLTNPDGKTASYGESAQQQTSSITDRLGGSTSIGYHAQTGKIKTFDNANKNRMAYTRTPRDQTFTNPLNFETVTFTFYNLTQSDYPDGTKETFTYDNSGNMLTRTDRAGKIWTRTYNGRGQVLTLLNPTGGTITYTYNGDATLASMKDPETGTTTYGYDAAKRLITITYPDASTQQYTYDNNDRIESTTDELGNVYRYTRDANGNLTVETDPDGNTETYTYDDMDRMKTGVDRRGKTTRYMYDNSINRVDYIVMPIQTNDMGYGYDANGNVTSTSIGGKTWRTTYDAEDVLTSDSTPFGYTTTYTTDSLGAVIAVSDPLSNKTSLVRDAMQRITTETDPLGRVTTYSYDAWDSLSGIDKGAISGAFGNRTGTLAATYARNPMGALTKITDPNGNEWFFGYSPMGRLTGSTDPLGNIRTNTYNNRGRPSVTTFPDNSTLTRTYDAVGNVTKSAYSAGPTINNTYDKLNRLTATDDISFTYDADGNVITTKSPATMSATYDDMGRLSSVTYPYNGGEFTVTYTYAKVRLSRVTDNLTHTQLDLTYDSDDRLIRVTRSNGVTTEYAWDHAGRLTRILHGSLADLKYTLNDAGEITEADQTVPLDPEPLLADVARAFNHDAACQVNTAGYLYDKLGRRTLDPDRGYTWNGAERPTAIGDAAFTYNGLGDPTTRTENNVTVRYTYHSAIGMRPIMAEKNETKGSYLRHYVYAPNGALLYMIDDAGSDNVYHYHFDNVGSTLFMTNSLGEISDAYAYTPYGELLKHEGPSEQPFTFIGKWGVRREGSSGTLYQMRARYYDAKTGNFLSRDPVWPVLDDVRSLNPYQYAKESPLLYIDPEGMQDFLSRVFWEPNHLVSERPSSPDDTSSSPSKEKVKEQKDLVRDLEEEARRANQIADVLETGEGVGKLDLGSWIQCYAAQTGNKNINDEINRFRDTAAGKLAQMELAKHRRASMTRAAAEAEARARADGNRIRAELKRLNRLIKNKKMARLKLLNDKKFAEARKALEEAFTKGKIDPPAPMRTKRSKCIMRKLVPVSE